jgi:hypothetical protein
MLLMVAYLLLNMFPKMFSTSDHLIPTLLGTENGKLLTSKPTDDASLINFLLKDGTNGL